MSFSELVFRGAYLGALTVVPGGLSPEPPAASLQLTALGALGFAVPIALNLLLRRASRSLESTAAVVASVIAPIALMWIANNHSGEQGPLLAGYYAAAPFVWIPLSISAASLAGHYLGNNWKNKKVGAAVAVLAVGFFLFRLDHELVSSPAAMWRAVLAADPQNELAFEKTFSGPKVNIEILQASADACLMRRPTACACLVGRADSRLRARDNAHALKDSKAAETAGCALDSQVAGATLRETLASSLAGARDWDGAQKAMNGAPNDRASSRLLVADALVKQARGDAKGAEDSARKALTTPDAFLSARDANLLVASLLMARNERNEARPILADLVKTDPSDSDAQYDLALLDDLGGNYNGAREGYLLVLRQSPDYRAARYNLALLTLRQGSVQEARHHAAKFVEAWPDDPRGGELVRLTGALPGAN